MSPEEMQLAQLASTLEELTDLSLAEAKTRRTWRRTLEENLDEMEGRLIERIEKAKPQANGSTTTSPAEGLYFSPSTLKKILWWLVPALISAAPHLYEMLMKHPIPVLKP